MIRKKLLAPRIKKEVVERSKRRKRKARGNDLDKEYDVELLDYEKNKGEVDNDAEEVAKEDNEENESEKVTKEDNEQNESEEVTKEQNEQNELEKEAEGNNKEKDSKEMHINKRGKK